MVLETHIKSCVVKPDLFRKKFVENTGNKVQK